MNLMVAMADYLEFRMNEKECVRIFGEAGQKLWKQYKKSDNAWDWFHYLTIDQADTLYIYLLRKCSEEHNRKKGA